MRIYASALLLSLAFTPPSTLLAGTITNSVTCQSGPTIVDGSTQCSTVNESVALGPATASTSASYAISGNELSFQFDQSAFATGTSNVGNPALLHTNATATSTVTLELDTSGPVRTGYLAVFTPVLNAPGVGGEGGESLSISAGGYSNGCGLGAASADPGSLNPGPCDDLPTNPESAEANASPFTLGEPFSVSLTQTTSASGGPIEGGSAALSSVVEFALFDSTTPFPCDEVGCGLLADVNVSEAPEPLSTGLALVGLAIVACARLRARGLKRAKPI